MLLNPWRVGTGPNRVMSTSVACDFGGGGGSGRVCYDLDLFYSLFTVHWLLTTVAT